MKRCAILVALLLLAPVAFAAPGKAITDAAKAGPDFQVQGEYAGELTGGDDKGKWGVQIIALGGGKFRAVGYPGGLPGDGWNEKEKREAEGQTEGDKTVLKNDRVTLTISGDTLTVANSGGEVIGSLKKVARKSPTLGAKPPKGATVLFDGSSVEHFPGAKMTDDGLLIAGATSKPKFQSGALHVEFLLPYMPEARGQGRGNSGCYLQGRYEVQMLDSFGLKGEQNECGGVYSIAAPRINMCYPPLAWQTYDIDFTTAEYKDGKKVKNATMTVRHNGVVIHEDLDLTHSTTAAPVKEGPEPGPVYLQNHGNPVRYRNIWIVEKK
jgi:hypothetical protein